MSIVLKKVWDKIKKYWQVFLGLFVGLFVALKMWFQLRAQKRVLQNEIETSKKIRDVEKDLARQQKGVQN